MHQYNLLISDSKEIGLRIIQTESYVTLIQRNPGLPHENCGDFYSHVPVDGLAQIVHDALKKNLGNSKDPLYVINSFHADKVDMHADYIIKEKDGLRLYSPELHTPDSKDTEAIYSIVALTFIEELFTNEKRGSLQQSLIEMEQRLMPLMNSLLDIYRPNLQK